MDVSNGFDFVNVVVHVNGTSAELSWVFFGCQPRYAAVPTTAWTEIVG
jgi:hypothetical protein